MGALAHTAKRLNVKVQFLCMSAILAADHIGLELHKVVDPTYLTQLEKEYDQYIE